MLGWFRRRWIRRDEHERMKASYETRISLLEAALAKHAGFVLMDELPPNLSLELLRRLSAKSRQSH